MINIVVDSANCQHPQYFLAIQHRGAMSLSLHTAELVILFAAVGLLGWAMRRVYWLTGGVHALILAGVYGHCPTSPQLPGVIEVDKWESHGLDLIGRQQ